MSIENREQTPNPNLPKILIVADGYLGFEPSDRNDFSISVPAAILKRHRFAVTTAHRGPETTKYADLRNFTFSDASLKDFDEVWLFGHNDDRGSFGYGPWLTDAELRAIVGFMNAGGGVFATGDHEDLGIRLCGRIPRVASMRRWKKGEAPHNTNENRHDTLRPSLTIGDYRHEYQGDRTPQELFARLLDTNGAPSVHRILRGPNDVTIHILPDHTHEGECVTPSNLEGTYRFGDLAGDEYPLAGQSRVAPQILGDTLVIGGHTTVEGGAQYPKVKPKTFGAICAYDGHTARVGRVVTEATWHHFMDINILELLKVPHYKQLLETYYVNIASWLGRPSQQRTLISAGLAEALRRYPLGELVVDGDPSDLEKALTLGGAARESLGAFEPQVVAALLEGAGTTAALQIEPNPFVGPDRVADAAVGGALLQFVSASRSAAHSETEPAAEPDLAEEAIRGAASALNALPQALKSFAARY